MLVFITVAFGHGHLVARGGNAVGEAVRVILLYGDIYAELIASQIKLDNSEKSVKTLRGELDDATRKLIRLETELKISE